MANIPFEVLVDRHVLPIITAMIHIGLPVMIISEQSKDELGAIAKSMPPTKFSQGTWVWNFDLYPLGAAIHVDFATNEFPAIQSGNRIVVQMEDPAALMGPLVETLGEGQDRVYRGHTM